MGEGKMFDSVWIMDFSNEFVSKTINSNFNFNRERKEEKIFWRIENFYILKLSQT